MRLVEFNFQNWPVLETSFDGKHAFSLVDFTSSPLTEKHAAFFAHFTADITNNVVEDQAQFDAKLDSCRQRFADLPLDAICSNISLNNLRYAAKRQGVTLAVYLGDAFTRVVPYPLVLSPFWMRGGQNENRLGVYISATDERAAIAQQLCIFDEIAQQLKIKGGPVDQSVFGEICKNMRRRGVSTVLHISTQTDDPSNSSIQASANLDAGDFDLVLSASHDIPANAARQIAPTLAKEFPIFRNLHRHMVTHFLGPIEYKLNRDERVVVDASQGGPSALPSILELVFGYNLGHIVLPCETYALSKFLDFAAEFRTIRNAVYAPTIKDFVFEVGGFRMPDPASSSMPASR